MAYQSLEVQVFPFRKRAHMESAIQAVRYTLKELMQIHGPEYVLEIIDQGSELGLKEANKVYPPIIYDKPDGFEEPEDLEELIP